MTKMYQPNDPDVAPHIRELALKQFSNPEAVAGFVWHYDNKEWQVSVYPSARNLQVHQRALTFEYRYESKEYAEAHGGIHHGNVFFEEDGTTVKTVYNCHCGCLGGK